VWVIFIPATNGQLSQTGLVPAVWAAKSTLWSVTISSPSEKCNWAFKSTSSQARTFSCADSCANAEVRQPSGKTTLVEADKEEFIIGILLIHSMQIDEQREEE
jgi:hypothetical protein